VCWKTRTGLTGIKNSLRKKEVKMITAGVDLGIETIKVVIVKDGQILASKEAPAGGVNRAQAAEQVWNETLQQAGLSASDVSKVIATGQGKWDVGFANDYVVEPVADVTATHWLFPSARSVIDVGADQARAARFDANGKITEHVLNQKCAAALGTSLESFARTLGVTPDGLAKLASESRNGVTVNDQCGVYAELDIVSLLHDNTPKADIAKAIMEAVATKLSSMVNEMTLDKDVALVGGVARNAGVVNSLKKRLGMDLLVPEDPAIAGALGAALIAAS